ncbi:hypothetical protein ATI61_105698 [Archangium gephyra]|uniref:Uncharacterized protein n=1 Tax=Archangium gephyra TaxID=48 RepID=A0ABX9K3A0_9BACT|nr:hypothetical protein ATI61_105698 [Archangium gephyra]
MGFRPSEPSSVRGSRRASSPTSAKRRSQVARGNTPQRCASCSFMTGPFQGREPALGRPHRLPARGVCPAAPKGTAAGPAGWASRGRVVHPVLRLRLAGDAALPLAGAGRCLRAAGGRRALRGVAAAHARRGGAVAEGGASSGAAPAGEKRSPARARARGRAASVPGALPAHCSGGPPSAALLATSAPVRHLSTFLQHPVGRVDEGSEDGGDGNRDRRSP